MNACDAPDCGLGDHQRNADVAADADRLVDRQAAEERHPHLLGHRSPPPCPKMLASWWHEGHS